LVEVGVVVVGVVLHSAEVEIVEARRLRSISGV
jgi:hypothetical protein